MSMRLSTQQGFAAIAAIFLLVVLAALGGFMITFSNTQQLTSAQDILGSRAYWAARSGLAWGTASVIASSAACPATTPTPMAGAPAAVDGFTLAINCSTAVYSDGSSNVTLFRLQAQASMGTAGTSTYIERSVSSSLEK